MNQQLDTNSPLLKSFQDLGAISPEFGMFKVKPFKDWKGENAENWKDKIFNIRICNAGELIDLTQEMLQNNSINNGRQMKVEILARAIYDIDGRELVTTEELLAYNKNNKTSIQKLEYLKLWFRNLENIVLDRLDAIYGALQLKQIRMLRGESMCEVCENLYTAGGVPEASEEILYFPTEIICGECIEKIDRKNYDFKNTVKETKEEDNNTNNEKVLLEETSFSEIRKCDNCGQEFNDYEDYVSHIRGNCPKEEKSI